MHLVKLEISNFRSVAKLSLELKEGANLIVGPNAVGKSTVLEAIRLVKAVLAPRGQGEQRQVLTSLGIVSNAAPQQMNYAAIAGNVKLPITINCTYRLSDQEAKELPEYSGELAQSLVAAQQGFDQTNPNGQLGMIQFFSTPMGKHAMKNALLAIQGHLGKWLTGRTCELWLTFDPKGGFSGHDVMSQLLFAVLERRLPPGKAMLSCFPADRALAAGDAQIQIGSADAAQQLESHNSQPALKYQRLKNVIFSTILAGKEAADQQAETFNRIFLGLLKEKSLGKAEVNKHGQATVMIYDRLSDRSFDIDSMSSGEKGLILTFLLIARSIEDGGLILLDEPELHLNPGVCRNLLDFLLDEYLLRMNVQAIICTHSPEIMSAAFRRTDCNLFSMRRNTPISLIRKSDHAEAADALKLLGTSEIESLLFDAVIFVEGPDDVDLLEFAFRSFLSRLKFRDLSGRGEVEKYIKLLVAADQSGKADGTAYFIFDRDNKPTSVMSTKNVKIKQWNRYCLENYLIEPEILYDTVRQELRPKTWPSTHGEANQYFESLAKKQLRGRIVEATYKELGLQDVRLRSDDKKDSFLDSANSLFTKIRTFSTQVASVPERQWVADFEAKCEARLAAEEPGWTNKWIEKCSGKQFLIDLYNEAGLKADMITLKRTLLAANRLTNSESWQLMTGTLQDLTNKV